YLNDAYRANGETSVDAGIVLMVFLRREHRYAEALQIAATIGPRFPRNYLLPLEEANLLRASGKSGEAEDQYRRVWQNGREGKYGNLHYEITAIGLGDLLRSEKKYDCSQSLAQVLAQRQSARAQPPSFQHIQSRQAGAHRQGVFGKRRGMNYRAVQ